MAAVTTKTSNVTTHSCPICYTELNIDNVINMQCKHKMCTNCFKGWVDEQCKNTCPCCRADVLTSSKQKMILQTKIDEFQSDLSYYRGRVKKERNKYNDLNDKNTNLQYDIEDGEKRIVEIVQMYDRETQEYFRYKHENETTKKHWDNNPDIAIQWWENKKAKLLRNSKAKHNGLTKELIKEVKQMSFKNEGFELMSKNIFHNIKETNAAEEILRLFEEEELGLDDCCNMFEEDDSTYTNGSELAVENRIIPGNTNDIRYDESEDADTETDNSDIESMPELISNSDDDMSVISDDEDLLNESIDTIEITLPTIRTPSPIEEQTIRHNTSLQRLIDDSNVTMRSFERRFLRSITRNLQHEFNIELATHFNSRQE